MDRSVPFPDLPAGWSHDFSTVCNKFFFWKAMTPDVQFEHPLTQLHYTPTGPTLPTEDYDPDLVEQLGGLQLEVTPRSGPQAERQQEQQSEGEISRDTVEHLLQTAMESVERLPPPTLDRVFNLLQCTSGGDSRLGKLRAVKAAFATLSAKLKGPNATALGEGLLSGAATPELLALCLAVRLDPEGETSSEAQLATTLQAAYVPAGDLAPTTTTMTTTTTTITGGAYGRVTPPSLATKERVGADPHEGWVTPPTVESLPSAGGAINGAGLLCDAAAFAESYRNAVADGRNGSGAPSRKLSASNQSLPFPELPVGWRFNVSKSNKYFFWKKGQKVSTYQHPVTGKSYRVPPGAEGLTSGSVSTRDSTRNTSVGSGSVISLPTKTRPELLDVSPLNSHLTVRSAGFGSDFPQYHSSPRAAHHTNAKAAGSSPAWVETPPERPRLVLHPSTNTTSFSPGATGTALRGEQGNGVSGKRSPPPLTSPPVTDAQAAARHPMPLPSLVCAQPALGLPEVAPHNRPAAPKQPMCAAQAMAQAHACQTPNSRSGCATPSTFHDYDLVGSTTEGSASESEGGSAAARAAAAVPIRARTPDVPTPSRLSMPLQPQGRPLCSQIPRMSYPFAREISPALSDDLNRGSVSKEVFQPRQSLPVYTQPQSLPQPTPPTPSPAPVHTLQAAPAPRVAMPLPMSVPVPMAVPVPLPSAERAPSRGHSPSLAVTSLVAPPAVAVPSAPVAAP
eukprot:RCo041763